MRNDDSCLSVIGPIPGPGIEVQNLAGQIRTLALAVLALFLASATASGVCEAHCAQASSPATASANRISSGAAEDAERAPGCAHAAVPASPRSIDPAPAHGLATQPRSGPGDCLCAPSEAAPLQTAASKSSVGDPSASLLVADLPRLPRRAALRGGPIPTGDRRLVSTLRDRNPPLLI